MERRNINPLIPHATTDTFLRNSRITNSNTQENIHYVAQRLAWIGDQIELRRASAQTGNIQRSIGRCLAAAGDLMNCRYNPLSRRNETFLRLLWRSFSTQDDGGLVFAGALLQVFYLVLQEMSQNM